MVKGIFQAFRKLETFGGGGGGGQAVWSSRGSQEIFVFRLSDIASGAFLGTEVSVLGLGLLSVLYVLWNESFQ